jgi:hypothetical protein
MTRTFTATGFDEVPTGMYVVEFAEIKDKTATFTEDGVEKTREYMSWWLPIKEGEHEGRMLFANVSNSFGPKSKLRRWAENMTGRTFEDGDEFDVDELVGKRYQAMVENVKKGDREYANVVGLYQLRDTDGDLKPKGVETNGKLGGHSGELSPEDEKDFAEAPF